MRSLLAPNWLTVNTPVKADAGLLLQNLVEQGRTFFGKDPRSLRRTDAGAGGKDVREQGLSTIARAATDDSSLCVSSVRFMDVRRACDDRDLATRITGQPQGGSCPGDAAANDQDFCLGQLICFPE
jgi:hypothetical protein